LFFVRFWRSSRDRLFLFFAIAFALLGIIWASLAVVHWVLVRLIAFLLIIVVVIDKNRRGRSATR
jgi:hypothetical protein